MRSRFTRTAVALAMACALGLNWDFLQSIAWLSMFAQNLQSLPATRALQQTLDGKHPCALCKAVAAGKKSDRRSPGLSLVKKLKGLSPEISLAAADPAPAPVTREPSPPPTSPAYAPPRPPPRAA